MKNADGGQARKVLHSLSSVEEEQSGGKKPLCVLRTMMVMTQHTAMVAIGRLARPSEKGPLTKSLALSSLMKMGMPSARMHAFHGPCHQHAWLLCTAGDRMQ